MTAKTIEVQCTCCSTLLTIDVLTRTVLRTAKPSAEGAKPDPERWDQALGKVEQRRKAGEGLDAMLDDERARRDSFDDLFDAAKDRVRKRSEAEFEVGEDDARPPAEED